MKMQNSKTYRNLSPALKKKVLLDQIKQETNYSNESSHIQTNLERKQNLELTKTHKTIARVFTGSSNDQVVIINDRKFIKSKSPGRVNPPMVSSSIFQTNEASNPNQNYLMKIRLLQNRIAQLHKEKQQEMIRLLNENKRIHFELQKQINKNLAMTNSTMNCLDLNNNRDEEYFEAHNVRIEVLKKKVNDIEAALAFSENQKLQLQKMNDSLQQEIQSFNEIRSGSETIEEKSVQISFKNGDNHMLQNSDSHEVSNQEKMKTQLLIMKEEIIRFEQKTKHLQNRIEIKNEQLEQKEHQILEINQNLRQCQSELQKLKLQNEYFEEKAKYLENQIVCLQTQIKNYSQIENSPPPSAKFAQSESIDLAGLSELKLKGISIQQSILINDKIKKSVSRESGTEDLGKMSFGSLAENSIDLQKKRSSTENGELDEKYVNSFKQFGFSQSPQICFDKTSQEKEVDQNGEILPQKIKLLKSRNNKINIQNQILNTKLEQLMHKNSQMAATIDMAFASIHKKEVQLETKTRQNEDLRKNLIEFSSKQQNKINSDKAFELTLSASCSQFDFGRKDCEKCQQLVKILSQFGMNDKIEQEMTRSLEIEESF